MINPLRILVNGARGRMGQLACTTIKNQKDFTLVGEANRGDNLEKMIRDTQADIVVDLTLPGCVFDNTKIIIRAGARPVIGTSGLLTDQIEQLKKLTLEKQIGGIIVPNFSLGNALLLNAAKQIACYLSDIEIIEAHHIGKVDSPSGTALHLANTLAKQDPHLNDPKKHTLQGPARGLIQHNIPIHALRTQGLLADMTALFGGNSETLSITHHAHDRGCYMQGMCLAIRHVPTISHLIVGLENILLNQAN